MPVKYCFDDGRCQQRQPQDPADIGGIDLLRPFQGDIAIGPHSYKLVYDQLMKK